MSLGETIRSSRCLSWRMLLLCILAVLLMNHVGGAVDPTSQPSEQPSSVPSRQPSSSPSAQPSNQPTTQPTHNPTSQPTHQPTNQPSNQPTRQPSEQPSSQPSHAPSAQPSAQPSRQPSEQPSAQPTTQPSDQPSRQPTSQPTNPTSQPSTQPSLQPTSHPTSDPCRTCLPGQYYDRGNVNGTDCRGCQACPPGYECTGKCSYPAACGPGEFQVNFGQALCSTCPSGTYNLLQAQTTCLNCAKGYYCDDPAQAPKACPAGYFSLPGAASCDACPAGTYKDQAGDFECIICPAGYACPQHSTTAQACTGGTYAPLGSAICNSCPPGYYCPAMTSALVYECEPGTYSTGDDTSCTVCPSGHACPFTTQALKQLCASGTYAMQGQTNCTICPAGKACDIHGSSIDDCIPGSYSPAGDALCTTCTAGNFCPYTTLAVEIPCAPGTYSLAGAFECAQCPAGRFCPSTHLSTQTSCVAGTFSTGNQAACTVCQAGYYCNSLTTATMTPCNAGYYSLSGANQCTQCPAGSYCPTRSSGPIQCSAGSYSSAGATICTLASPGYEVPNNGATTQAVCGVGYYSTGGSASCTLCSPGYHCPQQSTSPSPAGAACALGTWCNPADTVTLCLPGTYGVVTAGTSAAQACTACDPGYMCTASGTTAATRTVCPRGGYCPIGASAMTPCAAGYRSSATAQTSIATCQPCDRGTYCPSSGTINGSPCPAHYYCPEGTSLFSAYPCPAGTYSESGGLYSASQCQNCTLGHYCSGAASPVSCAAGTYNPYYAGTSSSACIPCEAGYACPSSGMTAMTVACSAGYYCLPGTTNPSQYACPVGTYSDSTSLTSQFECSQCTAGYTCGTHTRSATRVACALGSYCPLGTATGNDVPCPAGRYSSMSHLTAASECSVCLPGSYCSGGDTDVTGSCAKGYYCPAGTITNTQHACPAGTYSNSTNLYAVAQCTVCEAGHYCTAASTKQTACPAGTYAPNDGTAASSGCLKCTPGYYCTEGVSTPAPCGAGLYSDVGSDSCTICPRGTYCSSNTTANSSLLNDGGSWGNSGQPSGVCFNGTICTQGMTRVPDLLRDACPAGHYCPAGVPFPIQCPAGRYNGATGQDALSDCLHTPAGYYSEIASTEPTNLCEPGYYCPVGSTTSQQVPCPLRTYLPEYGGASVADCSICTAGGYCPQASIIPTVCTRGYYCVTGVSNPLPCVPGTYGNSTGLTSVDECTPCDGGRYCDGYALTAPRGPCEKGFYCVSASNTSTPRNLFDYSTSNLSHVGGLCPAGHYCEEGSIIPTPCPAGSFNTHTGSDSPGACGACPAGSYCESTGNINPTGQCDPGYYCTGGSAVSTQHESDSGHYSIGGAAHQTECSPGINTVYDDDCPSPQNFKCTYNMEHRRSSCDPCPLGFYCPISGLRNYTDFLCPPGKYCPLETINPFRCPAGTFSPNYGNMNVTQCTPCTTGNYCEFDGLVEVTDPCDAGYYCTINARSRIQATVTATGGPCTKGHYCQAGTSSPNACPRGTFMSATHNIGEKHFNGTNYFCDLCPNGLACDGIALTNYTSIIAAGYWSVIGAPTAAPVCNNQNCTSMFGICPTGSYCPPRSTLPLACAAGTYQDEEGQGECKVCPSGMYCLHETTTPVICPAGSFCPEGTRFSTEFLCPNGTYSDQQSLTNITECTDCTPGSYCGSPGLTEPTGVCRVGYFCGGGSSVATPHESGEHGFQISYIGETCVETRNTTINDICPPGHYCGLGSDSPAVCPPGTNSSAIGLVNVTDCPACTRGFYCPLSGTVFAVRKCLAGYFCPAGTANVGNNTDLICPLAHACPEGSAEPITCEAGFYQDEMGQSECKTCPSGSYCLYNTTTPVICPAGSFCPEGTRFSTEFLCPNGTFGDRESLTNITECTDCTPGYYCASSGLDAPTGKCNEGYFCGGGSTVAAPHESGEHGFQISYIGETCVQIRNTTLNDVCPPGHYCPEGSPSPVKCPPGRNSSSTGLAAEDDCPLCTRGFYCPHSGTVFATRKCVAGNFCPIGTAALGNDTICPAGAYCPFGSPAPQACGAGTFQTEVGLGQESCRLCPAGYYCLLNTGNPEDCPAGSYCPEGTKFGTEFLCPNGTYSDKLNLRNVTQCTQCTPGSYCGSSGLSEPTGPCKEGYFCGGGSSVASPHESGKSGYKISYVGETCVETSNTTINDVCRPGHYCPVGSDSPVQCPPGTNSSAIGLVNVTDCPACTRGFYCPLSGTVFAVRKCLAGYFCPAGTATVGDSDTLICPFGAQCPFGSAEPTVCDAGTYQDEVGQSVCKTCPSGSYCLYNTTTPVPCPAGSFCPEGTRFSTEFLCPNGTYSDKQSLTNVTECTDCTPGSYCGSSGLTEPTAECREGYFCGGGSSVATPHESGKSGYKISYVGETCVETSNTTINDVCRPGHYCPVGSQSPVQCPPGTNSSAIGLVNVTDCPACTRGFYCPLSGTVFAVRKCLAGYFCPSGTSVLVDDLLCPTGTYCPAGSPAPVLCDPGTYQDEIGQETCKVCTSGDYCLYNTTTPEPCPAGSFCPAGTRFSTEFLCPNGTYSNQQSLTNVTECTDCTPGSYCGSPGLTEPTGVCREGYFCGGGSSVATPHESGEHGFQISYIGETCVETRNTTLNDICPPGHYCPVGSDSPIQCPPGTNSSSTGLVNVTDCPLCTQGFYCPLNGTVFATRLCLANYFCPYGTGALDELILCPTGAHCPTGSPEPQICDAGLYQDEVGQSDCKTCPSGSYCLYNTTTPVPCPAGSFCPAGTRFSTEFLCPNGTYSNQQSLTNVTECTDCTPGSYCGSSGLTEPTGVCREGYFCGGRSSVATPHESGEHGFQISYIGETCVETRNTTINDICPPGHYCPVGSDSPIQCPPGTNSSSTGLVNVTDCPLCTQGFYCPLNGTVFATRLCLANYFCPYGTGALNESILCPTGAHCPTGSPEPQICDAGLYQDEVGQSVCKICPSGSYCLYNTTTPVPCPAGSFCPAGTRFSTEFLCPNGTYSNQQSLTNVTECTDCTPGSYCGSSGLTEPTGVCREGYFCGGRSSVATPHESGKSGVKISYVGEACVETSNTTINDVCRPGHYCPAGSESPVQCPPGTNSSAIGLMNVTDCPACTRGFYCPLSGTVFAVRKCLAGYFCPAGTANVGNNTDLICPFGAQCPFGSAEPTVCDAGTYQDEVGQSVCKTCPSGSYCLYNTTTPEPCPAGSFCPAGTRFSTEFLCPNGTYSDKQSLTNVTQCTDCTPGSFCGSYGLTQPTSICKGGYFCGGGSSVATPHDSSGSGFQISYIGETCLKARNGTINDICPPGHYCLPGSESPIKCPPGTNSSALGLVNVTDCPACTTGFYCPLSGTVFATRRCLAGYFCPPGTATVGAAPDLLCPVAHMCPFGSELPMPCAAGSYQDELGQASCKVCPSGSYCLYNTTTPEPCPAGSFCPDGTRFSTEFLCPNGTYSDEQSLTNVTACTPCTPGSYCGSPGLTEPTAECTAGYFCGGGSSVATPHESGAINYQISYVGETCVQIRNTTLNDVCPPGHFCPPGSNSPVPCPAGTNSSATGLLSAGQCPPCHHGYYCPLHGTVYASRKCLPGYYCPAGTANPSNRTELLCPNATMCPLGSAEPTICPGGTFQNEIGRSTCKICPAGYICDVGTIVPHTLCPLGEFCVPGSYRGAYCTNGTYGLSTGLINNNECTPCPAGKYCTHGVISGDCSAGYFCKIGQSTPSPPFDTTLYPNTQQLLSILQALDGGPCFPGGYCPKGSTYPLPCANSTVRAAPYGAQPNDCGPCPAGYTCSPGNPVPSTCSMGKYCPEGESAIDCPRGTYQPSIIKSSRDDCLTCPPGYFCNSTAITTYLQWPCPTGQFCLNGTTDPLPCPSGTFRNTLGAGSQSACFTCPPGRYCPEESSIYLSCPAGFYCPTGSTNYTLCPPGFVCGMNTSEPVLCPESYYCPLGTSVPKACIYGTYCPTGTDFPKPCPYGYKAVEAPNNTLSVLSILGTACEACPAGYYGADPDRLVCTIGTPGYYFIGATTSAYPRNISTQNGAICPVGHYCPEGSTEPTPCPAGKFLSYVGASNFSECTVCPENTYQFNSGSESCFKCSSSSISKAGADLCTCSGRNRAFQPEDGYCICKPGYEFVDSNLQVSSEKDGSYDCQPIVRARCAQTDIRLFDGSCAASDGYCDSFCGTSGGVISSTSGTCVCNNITTLAEICDSDCLAAATMVTCNADKELVATDPTTGEVTVLTADDLDSQGTIDCTVSGSSVYSMSVTSGRFEGFFGTNDALSSAIARRRRRMTGLSDQSWTANGYIGSLNVTEGRFTSATPRRLATEATITNPVVSISAGDTIIFDVSNDNYPLYVKDSLLNTNPDFDYSEFRALAEAAKTSLTVTTFSFTFTEEGTYVFQLSTSASSITLITVLAKNVARSTDAQFVEFSDGNLIVLGVKSDDSIVVSPDWNLVIGLLIGMLALVLLVIGFLYYFRKRAWSHHAHVDPSYRKKNKKVTPEAKKGPGMFSGAKGNKVFAADSSEHDKSMDQAALTTDVESPADGEDLEFDDEMLIPELAKHMQSHHDEIDRQLVNQNDLLNSLQETLKKEVDELKNLLNTTAMDIAMGAGADGKNKRLRALLMQLRSDTLTRGMYEAEIDTTEKRILALIEQVRKTLSAGAAVVSNGIVHEMAQQAMDLFQRDDPIHDLHSTKLEELIQSLDEIKVFTADVLLVAVAEEKRRARAADEAFDHGVRNLRDANFPQDVSEKLKHSKDADVDTDVAYDDIVSVLRNFSDNIPKFVNAMKVTESDLGRGLARTVEKSNPSLLEREQNIANKAFANFVDDLFGAVKVLVTTVTDRMRPSGSARVRGMVRRDELIAAIDNALRNMPTGSSGDNDNIQQLLEPLLAALKEAGTLNFSAQQQGVPGVTSALPMETIPEDSVVDQAVVNTVLANENLTEEQKEGIIGSAENDLKVMDSIIELERKRQEDAIAQAIRMNDQVTTADEDTSAADALKYEAEQQALMAALLAARTEELKDLTADDGVDTKEALQDKRIDCLARTRYTAYMRYWSSHARISYKEMHMHYQLQRIQVQIGMYDANSPIAQETGEVQLTELIEEEAGEIEELSKANAEMLRQAEASEQQVRETWAKNPDKVNIAAETETLVRAYKDQFVTLKTRLKDLSLNIRQHCKLCGVLTFAMLASRKNKVDDKVYSILMDAAKKEVETSKDTIEALQEDDLRILFAEETQLFEILAHASAWDGKTDERSAQSQLHLRELAGIQVNASVKNRLANTEFELKAEIEQIRTFTDLLRHGADKAESERVLADLAAKKVRESARLAATLQEKTAALNKTESDRQQRAAVNYERERAQAFEQNSYREIVVANQLMRSLRDLQKSVDSALSEKRGVMLNALRENSQMTEEVKRLTVKQIEAEAIREELGLRAAYDSIEEGYVVCERYLCEVVQGIEPSSAYIQQKIRLFNCQEMHLLQESIYMEDARRKLKKLISAYNYKAFEASRLRSLGRSEEDIRDLFEDVDQHTREGTKLIDVATSSAIWRLKSLYTAQLEDKASIHKQYETDVSKLSGEFEQQKSMLRTRFDGDRQYVVDNVQRNGDAADANPERTLYELEKKFTAALARAELVYCENLYNCFKAVIAKIVSDEASGDELRGLRQRLDNETTVLEDVLELSTSNKLDDLIRVQTTRRAKEEQEFREANEDFTARSAELAAKEDDESKALRADVLEKEQQSHNSAEQAHNAILEAASGASRASKQDTEEELKVLREQYDREIVRLKDSLLDKATKEKSNLQKRLNARKGKRISDLKQEGKSETEASAIVASEDEKAMEDLSDKLEFEAAEVVAAKRKEGLEAESKLIAREHEIASMAAANALRQKEAAQNHLKEIREQHEREAKQLDESMHGQRKSQEDNLKSRLAQRRAEKLRGVTDGAERQKMEVALQHEEHKQLMELERLNSAEEERSRQEQLIKQEAQEAEVREELKRAEIEVAKAAAKEAALRSFNDLQARAQEDINLREVQRMREVHDRQDEKRRTEQEHKQKAGKGKLEERLQAKRAKREKELREGEAKALAELQAKQKAEAEEKEQNRIAKMAWSEKVQEVIFKAQRLGMSDLEREDYCFKETLGQNMVPDRQLNEAVNLIQKERHDAEMTSLLKASFEERIAALKSAVEKVIETKSHAKVDLVESLASNGASEESIQLEIAKLDAEFNKKQLEAERAATGELEPLHLKAQMDLRQRQLQEMANVVSLYTDPASLAHLQSSTGKSQEEELLAYKAKIEEEKRAREEAIHKERQLTEQRLRDKLSEDMRKIASDLEIEQRRAEAEFELKKKEVARQREDMERKQLNEMGEMDQAQKARILSTFEKEEAAALEALDQDRKNKKNKLADRLNRRRSAATGAPAVKPSEQLVMSSAAVQGGGPTNAITAISNKLAAFSNKAADGSGAMIEASPALAQSMNLIESKLERIERVIMTLERNGIKQQQVPHTPQTAHDSAGFFGSTRSGAPPLPAYTDKDEPAPGEALEVMPESEVQMQEMARIEFGKRIAAMIGLKSLNIKAAYSLPPSMASNNAFCNSYYYNSGDNTLLVHTNRLSSSGDFGLIVIHALSHIKVNPSDLSNDADPKFLAEFYKNLKILSQDLYKKSVVASTSAAPFGSPAGKGGDAGARNPKLGKSKAPSFGPRNADIQVSMAAAVSSIAEDRDRDRESGGTGGNTAFAHPADYFTAESLHERMKTYAQQGGIPLDYLDRYAAGRGKGTGEHDE